MATAVKTPAPRTTERLLSIDLPPRAYERVHVRLRGVTPLLSNRFTEAAQASIEINQAKGAKLANAPRDADGVANDARHRLADGRDGLPAIAVKRAMVTAGQRFANEKGTVLRGALVVEGGDLLPLTAPEPTRSTERVVIPATRKTTLAHRPKYWPWSVDVTITYNTTILSRDQVLNILQEAGSGVGVGAWRVENNGNCGQFVVDGAWIDEESATPAATA